MNTETLLQLIKVHETAIKEQGKQIIHLREELLRKEKTLQNEINWLKSKMYEIELNNPYINTGEF